MVFEIFNFANQCVKYKNKRLTDTNGHTTTILILKSDKEIITI